MFQEIYLFSYSQVEPTPNNPATSSLSRDTQIQNRRRVAINVRVTSVIWMLEIVANICIVVVWILIYGSTSFGSLTNSMIWYYLILPYTFLMNTSYNKNRILADGWKTVIVNSVNAPFYWFLCRRDSNIPKQLQHDH